MRLGTILKYLLVLPLMLLYHAAEISERKWLAKLTPEEREKALRRMR